MAIKCQHYLFTFHPIKLHIFLLKLYLTNSSISDILITAIHIFQKPVTLNIADKALCVSVAFMKYCSYLIKLKKNDRQLNDPSRP